MKKHYSLFLPFILFSCLAYSADTSSNNLNNTSLMWGIPFLGVLLSIAVFPLLQPRLWHHHYGKIVLGWTLLFLGSALIYFGFDFPLQITTHAIISDYVPFILLLLALFTVSGGILLESDLQGTPKINLCLLAIGTLLASIMGTTGAAMLMIRPLIRINRQRKQRTHIIIFFIFLVANIGGGLTPLGDPPLFIGFLKGVDFFWTVKHMLLPVAFNTVLLLLLFYFIDNHFYIKQANIVDENSPQQPNNRQLSSVKIYGIKNILLLCMIVMAVLLSGVWQSDHNLTIFGQSITLPNLIRDGLFVIITITSLIITPKQIYIANEFNWAPIIEVGKLFIAIFITITPILAILREGSNGALAPIVSLVTSEQGEPINRLYFWLSGSLSGFLDNAPTYLVFFNLAAGDAAILTTKLSSTLLAISMGSVFMGALTYIGNAPNFMVKTIAIQNQIAMPSFFGYMKWSLGILIPLFLIDTWLFF